MTSDSEDTKDYVDRKDGLLEAIQKAGVVQPNDRKELYDMLRRPSLQRALHQVLVESDAQAASMLAVNLEDPIHRAAATKAQGSAFGLLRAVESIIDNIPEEDNDNA